VNPGSAIQFVTPEVGWRIDDQFSAPHLDDQVSAGPNGTIFAWPGTGVSATSDGGASWAPIAENEFGIWGLDLLTEKTGWLVGVTSLRRTDDGGASWQELGEPAGTHLVAVAFSSETVGIGLTTEGSVFRTNDGGTSWSPDSSIKAPGIAICSDAAGNTFLSDGSGNVFVTQAGETGWTLSLPSPIEGEAASTSRPFWSSLTCGDDSVWQVTDVLDMQLHTGLPYAVNWTADAGGSWQTAAAYSGDSAIAVPKAAAPFPEAYAADGTSSGGFIVGLPPSGFGLDVADVHANNDVAEANVPAIQSSVSAQSSAGYIHIVGASSIGSSAWILFNNAAFGTKEAPADQLTVLSSNDGGQTWSVAAAGPIEPEPPLSYDAPPPPTPSVSP
jgi:hypothetical protein